MLKRPFVWQCPSWISDTKVITMCSSSVSTNCTTHPRQKCCLDFNKIIDMNFLNLWQHVSTFISNDLLKTFSHSQQAMIWQSTSPQSGIVNWRYFCFGQISWEPCKFWSHKAERSGLQHCSKFNLKTEQKEGDLSNQPWQTQIHQCSAGH